MIDLSKPCESFDQACAEVVDILSSWTGVSWLGYAKSARYNHRPTPAFFSNAMPFGHRWDRFFDLPGGALDMNDHESWSFVSGSIDYADTHVCDPFRFGEIEIRPFRVSRTRTVSRHQAGRHVMSSVSGRLFEVTELLRAHHKRVGENVMARRDYYCESADGSFFNVTAGFSGHRAAKDYEVTGIKMRGTLCFSMRYEWRVAVGVEGAPSTAFVVDREACKEIFRLRDAPPGRSRRAALLNFVTQHWKRSRSQAPTEDPQVFVREHLRGQTKFKWNGLTCEVIPPKYDVERLEKAKQA